MNAIKRQNSRRFELKSIMHTLEEIKKKRTCDDLASEKVQFTK